MIERLQKISAELFKNALKTYTLKDVITHKRAHHNNIPELLSLYPNKGVGFFVYKKNWTPGIHYEIRRADFKSHRNGSFYGLQSKKVQGEKSKVMNDYPQRIQGLSKRGIWTYNLGKFQSFKNDNGVIYTRADYQAFVKIRGVGVKKEGVVKREADQRGEPGPEATETE